MNIKLYLKFFIDICCLGYCPHYVMLVISATNGVVGMTQVFLFFSQFEQFRYFSTYFPDTRYFPTYFPDTTCIKVWSWNRTYFFILAIYNFLNYIITDLIILLTDWIIEWLIDCLNDLLI